MSTYKDEKRGTWYCKFYYTDWKNEKKQHLKRGFKLKKDAAAYEADYKANASKMPQLLFSTLAAEYLEDYKKRRKENSYKLAEANLRIHILPHISNIQVDKITPITIRTWQNLLLDAGYKDSTLNSINNTFRSVMSYAVKFYNLATNPFGKTDSIGKRARTIKIIEREDWDKLIAVIENKHDKALFTLLYWSGLRIGEAQGLCTDDIDFDSSTITIDKQYDSDRKTFRSTKTEGSKRTIYISSFVMETIKEYFDALIEVPQYPFTLNTSRGLNFKLDKYCKKAGIPSISLHAFRHAHASLLIAEGFPANVVAERLGHSSAVTTMRLYAHRYKGQDSDLAAKLNQIK